MFLRDLIPFLMAAAVLVHDVNLVVTHLLQTGVLFTQPVTAIVVKTEPWNHAILNVVVPAALQVGHLMTEEVPARLITYFAVISVTVLIIPIVWNIEQE